MTNDDKALVDDLLDEDIMTQGYGIVALMKTCRKAADRIEALSAENERLREYIERLRKALYAAYDDEPGWCDLTRAALGEQQ